ncbi:hypothetical protein NEOKW01_1006 [Nematocida sp. AWRm80]|nr:hypothetical protein NEOKW01_1006 [Nematocida sp. AWRm80]
MRIGKGTIEKRHNLERKIFGFIIVVSVTIFWMIFFVPMLSTILFLTSIKRNLDMFKITEISTNGEDNKIKITIECLGMLPVRYISGNSVKLGLVTARNESPFAYLECLEMDVQNERVVTLAVEPRIPKQRREIEPEFVMNTRNALLFILQGSVDMKILNGWYTLTVPISLPYNLSVNIGNSQGYEEKLIDRIKRIRKPKEIITSKDKMPVEMLGYKITENEKTATIQGMFNYSTLPPFANFWVPGISMDLCMDKEIVCRVSVNEHIIQNGRATKGVEFKLEGELDGISNLRKASIRYFQEKLVSLTLAHVQIIPPEKNTKIDQFIALLIRNISNIYKLDMQRMNKRELDIRECPLMEIQVVSAERTGIYGRYMFNDEIFPYANMVEVLNQGTLPPIEMNLCLNDMILSKVEALHNKHISTMYKDKMLILEGIASFDDTYTSIGKMIEHKKNGSNTAVRTMSLVVQDGPYLSRKLLKGFGIRWKTEKGMSVGFEWIEPSPSTDPYIPHTSHYTVQMNLLKERANTEINLNEHTIKKKGPEQTKLMVVSDMPETKNQVIIQNTKGTQTRPESAGTSTTPAILNRGLGSIFGLSVHADDSPPASPKINQEYTSPKWTDNTEPQPQEINDKQKEMQLFISRLAKEIVPTAIVTDTSDIDLPSESSTGYPNRYSQILLATHTPSIHGQGTDKNVEALSQEGTAPPNGSPVPLIYPSDILGTMSISLGQKKEKENFMRVSWITTHFLFSIESTPILVKVKESWLDILSGPNTGPWSIRNQHPMNMSIYIGKKRACCKPGYLSLLSIYTRMTGIYSLFKPIKMDIFPKKTDSIELNKNNSTSTSKNTLRNSTYAIDTIINALLKHSSIDFDKGSLDRNTVTGKIVVKNTVSLMSKIQEPAFTFQLIVPPTHFTITDNKLGTAPGDCSHQKVVELNICSVTLTYTQASKMKPEMYFSVLNATNEKTNDIVFSLFMKKRLFMSKSLTLLGKPGSFFPCNRSIRHLAVIIRNVITRGESLDTAPQAQQEITPLDSLYAKPIYLSFKASGIDEGSITMQANFKYGNPQQLEPETIGCKNGFLTLPDCYYKAFLDEQPLIELTAMNTSLLFAGEPISGKVHLKATLFGELFNQILSDTPPTGILKHQIGHIKNRTEKNLLQVSYDFISQVQMYLRDLQREPNKLNRSNENNLLDNLSITVKGIQTLSKTVLSSQSQSLNTGQPTDIKQAKYSQKDILQQMMKLYKIPFLANDYTTPLSHELDTYIPTNKRSNNPIDKIAYLKNIEPKEIYTPERSTILSYIQNIISLSLSEGMILELQKNLFENKLSTLLGTKKRNIFISIEIKNIPLLRIDYKTTQDQTYTSPAFISLANLTYKTENLTLPIDKINAQTAQNIFSPIDLSLATVTPQMISIMSYKNIQYPIVEYSPIINLADLICHGSIKYKERLEEIQKKRRKEEPGIKNKAKRMWKTAKTATKLGTKALTNTASKCFKKKQEMVSIIEVVPQIRAFSKNVHLLSIDSSARIGIDILPNLYCLIEIGSIPYLVLPLATTKHPAETTLKLFFWKICPIKDIVRYTNTLYNNHAPRNTKKSMPVLLSIIYGKKRILTVVYPAESDSKLIAALFTILIPTKDEISSGFSYIKNKLTYSKSTNDLKVPLADEKYIPSLIKHYRRHHRYIYDIFNPRANSLPALLESIN